MIFLHEAEHSRKCASELAGACQVRNGLMVSLLALCPIVLMYSAGLEIGGTFCQH